MASSPQVDKALSQKSALSSPQDDEASVSDIRYLKGVGPKRALALERLGVRSVQDLLYFFPRRYEDRSHYRSMDQLTAGEFATVRGEVLTLGLRRLKRLVLFEMAVGDSSGILTAVWFNQPYLKNQFSVGQQVIVYGRVDLYQNRLQITSPEYELVEPEEEAIHTGRITPIYPLTEGLFQRSLRTTLKEVIENQLEKNISEYLPETFLGENQYMKLAPAVSEMHFPTSFEALADARKRIVFDEFFKFELLLLHKMERLKKACRAHSLSPNAEAVTAFEKSLPFKLTPSQTRAIKEILADLGQAYPMNRLLQGDVGSGKTVVAAFALLMAAQNKKQGGVLVPTEILAEQHFRKIKEWLEPFHIKAALLTASTPADSRERFIAALRQNKISVLIGTHAILQSDVKFHSLALLVVDEQHKFGVYQRCQLLQQDPRPHQLVMTATPIPRTLALTVYGDLKTSVMKELPAGRSPIKTYWIKREKQKEVLGHIIKKIKEGDQAYFIFPVIEETEKSDLLAAKKEFDRLKKGAFAKIKMGLIHGRLAAEERESMMRGFRRGEISVLIATSVIEVGVDNPNATMMVIENAERFGLSQLHQMRGRIGRGQKASECFLFGEPRTEEGQKRLRILTKTQDGFVIAEEDLKLRGPGDFWGSRQSGEALFRVADPIEDEAILIKARETAMDLIHTRKIDNAPEWQGVKNLLEQSPIKY